MLPIYFTSIHISVWLHQVDSFPTDGAYPRSQNRGIAPAHIIYTEIVFRHVLYQITCNNNFQTHCEVACAMIYRVMETRRRESRVIHVEDRISASTSSAAWLRAPTELR